jgi:cobalt-zinc-cadmium efflux system membrane fusion protein
MNVMHHPPGQQAGHGEDPHPTRGLLPGAAPSVEEGEITQAAGHDRRPSRMPWLLAGLAVLAAGGGWWFLSDAPVEATRPAQRASAAAGLAPSQFRLSEAEMRSLKLERASAREFRDERVAEGRISYNDDRSTPVFFPYNGGRVVRANVQLGQSVKRGDVLMEVESTDLVTAVNALLAATDAANKSRSARDLAQRQATRAASLFAAKAASQADLETAQAGLRSAEADLRSALTAEQAARDSLRVLGRTPEQVAEVERTRLVDAIVPLLAPLDGVVTQRRVGPGQWLTNGGSEPVFTIADIATMWLVAQVREVDVPQVKVGQPVQVRVGALPGEVFQARITHAAAGLNPETRRLTVRAEIEDPGHRLVPEMFASFRIQVGAPAESVALRPDALVFRGAEAFVWVSPDNGLFELRRVRVGLRDQGHYQIIEGLRLGENVVTAGALFVDRAARID